MSDKNIKIGIGVTGAQQAAAEIQRVDKATDGLGKSQTTVSSASVNMRMGLQNVGYQLQDFAVQVSSGTSATRAFAQQAPQLLSAFGPWGVALGTVVALGAPLAGMLFQQADGAEKAAEKAEGLKDVIEDYAEASKIATEQKASENLQGWFDALDDEADKIERNNKRLEKSIELQVKLKALKGEVESAERALEIARIQSDPNLSDADKTRQIAAYKERDERRRAEARIDALNTDAQLAANDFRTADSQFDVNRAAVQKALEKKAEIEAKIAQDQQSDQAAARVPDIEARLRKAKQQVDQTKTAVGSGFAPQSALAEANAEVDRIRKELEAAVAEGGSMSESDRAARKDENLRNLEIAKGGVKDAADAAKTARTAYENALSQMLQKQALARESAPLIAQEYRTQREARAVTTEAQAKAQEEAAALRLKQENERRANEEQRRQTKNAGDLGREAERLLPADVSKQLRESVEKVSKGLRDGDQGGELKQLADLMEKVAGAVGQVDQQSKKRIATLEGRINELIGQIKNDRK